MSAWGRGVRDIRFRLAAYPIVPLGLYRNSYSIHRAMRGAEQMSMKGLLAAFLVGLAVAAPSVRAAEAPASPKEPDYAAQIAAAGLADTDVGFLVVDLADGKVVAEHNPDRLFIPASVAKIPTVAAALEILGAQYRFVTTVEAVGEVRDGVLAGTLVLRGGGDPFLSSDDLKQMADQLAATGIRSVEGPFLYDATALVEIPQINPMQPEAAGYNTGVSALSVNFNRVRVNWQKSAANATAAAMAVSEAMTLPIDAIALSFAAADAPGPYVRSGDDGEESWLLSPTLADKGEDWLPVGNPSLITAEVFRALAAAEGIDLPEPTAGATLAGGRELVRHESIPLDEIASGVLKYSNNLSAELIGLTASKALTHRVFDLADSGSALAAWWQLRLPAVDWTGIDLENHSGLSSDSRASPRQIVVMLEAAAKSAGGADFHDLLKAISWKGVKGTARVKTGTMSYGRGLAGYIDTASGRRLAFAIFFNDLDKRAALDAAFNPYNTAIDPESRHWRGRVLKLEQDLTSGWAAQF